MRKITALILGLLATSAYPQATGQKAGSQTIGTDLSGFTVTPSGQSSATTMANHTAGWWNVRSSGVKCDGSTNDTANLGVAAGVASASGVGLLIPCKVRLSSAAGTITVPVRFEGGGSLDLQPGGSITLAGEVVAGLHQIFYYNGGTLGMNAKTPWVYPQWWGAAGTSLVDDTAAIQAAIDVSGTAGIGVYLPLGAYLIRGHLNIGGLYGSSVVFRGASMTGSVLYKDNASSTNDYVVAVWGFNHLIENFTILGAPKSGTASGYSADVGLFVKANPMSGIPTGAKGIGFNNITIERVGMGIRMGNYSTITDPVTGLNYSTGDGADPDIETNEFHKIWVDSCNYGVFTNGQNILHNPFYSAHLTNARDYLVRTVRGADTIFHEWYFGGMYDYLTGSFNPSNSNAKASIEAGRSIFIGGRSEDYGVFQGNTTQRYSLSVNSGNSSVNIIQGNYFTTRDNQSTEPSIQLVGSGVAGAATSESLLVNNDVQGILSVDSLDVFSSGNTYRGTGQAYARISMTGVAVGDTFTVNGVTFTAVASGPTGNQFVRGTGGANQAANDTTSAANLAAAVQASTTAGVQNTVGATLLGTTATTGPAYVYVYYGASGTTGNSIAIAQTGGHITLPGSTLANGTASVSAPALVNGSLISAGPSGLPYGIKRSANQSGTLYREAFEDSNAPALRSSVTLQHNESTANYLMRSAPGAGSQWQGFFFADVSPRNWAAFGAGTANVSASHEQSKIMFGTYGDGTFGFLGVGSGTVAPTSGTWATGDRVWNTAPVEAGTASSKYVVMGWICTAGGSPGTWLPMRTLTGN